MKRPLMGFGIALVAGVAAAWYETALWFVLTAAVVYVICCRFWAGSSWKYNLGLFVFFIVGFCRTLSGQNNQISISSEITGSIYKIQQKEKCLYFSVKTSENEKVLAIIMNEDIPEQIFYKGQVVSLRGEAEVFSEPVNPGQFNEKNYYMSQGIDYRIWAEKVELVSEGNKLFLILRVLEKLKKNMADVYDDCMCESSSGVLRAAVLGDRSGFGGDLRRYYQKNGWLHLITVSGLHLSFIAAGFYQRIRKWGIGLTPSVIAALIIMGAYGYMADFGDSMLRAMGMMFFLLAGDFFGRRADTPTSAVLTCAVMLIKRPERCLSSGFLLSFAAVGGMILGNWFFGQFESKKKDCFQNKIKKALSIQAGIFLTTLPLVLWYMFEIPVLGLFYNFFMIPFVSMLVPAAFLWGLAGSFPLAFISDFSRIFLSGADKILNIIHKLPSAVWVCGRPALRLIFIYIICIAVGVVFINYKKSVRGKFLLLAACFLIAGWRGRKDRIICMDVGQGDAVCVITRSGRCLFIDGGSSDVKGLYEYRIEPLLKYYGVRCIDVWFLTHGDNDHVSGIREALSSKGISVRHLLLPDVPEDKVLSEIILTAEGRRIQVQNIYPGDAAEMGDFRLTCLYPEKGIKIKDKNNASLVLMLKRKNFTMLLTGDLERDGEEVLLEQRVDLNSNVLKAGHHGSSGASSERFLEAVRPEWTIISCGLNNVYGHPHKETLERLKAAGSQWVSTAQQGALTIEFKDETYQIQGYCKKEQGCD